MRVPSVKACSPSEGVHQLEVTVLEVILHVIPEIHCGEEKNLDVRAPLLSQSHPHPYLVGPWVFLTSNAAVGLLDMVEPHSWQVQQFACPNCAVKGVCQAVTGVADQVWSQGVQWDPGHLEIQQLPGPEAPKISSSVPSPPSLPTDLGFSVWDVTSPDPVCPFPGSLPLPQSQEQNRYLFHGLLVYHPKSALFSQLVGCWCVQT